MAISGGTDSAAPRRSEEEKFVDEVRKFLCTSEYVTDSTCHFRGDSVGLADVELQLNGDLWPGGMPNHLILEAKTHHTKDSPNTINKIFGQLLTEASKLRRKENYCLGILIPTDGAEWIDNNKKVNRRGSGIDYYRIAFNRIRANLFSEYGKLVDAKYVLAFSVEKQELTIFGWNEFYEGAMPIQVLVARNLQPVVAYTR